MQGIAKGYYTVAVWVCRFVYVNMLWLVFTLSGFVLFGLFPATAAMFTVVRKWIAGEEEVQLLPLFWQSYKKEFLQANLLGFILAVTGYLLTIEFQVLRFQDSLAYFIASYGVVALMILFCIVLLFFFPVYAHFHLHKRDYFKWPFIIGIMHPLLTVCLAGVVLLFYYVLFHFVPALLLFIGGSVPAYLISRGAALTFNKYEETKEPAAMKAIEREKVS